MQAAQSSIKPLLTDLYQLTMAQGYFLSERPLREASFSLTFRENPFGGGYAIAGGIGLALDFLENLTVTEQDIEYLRTIKANDGTPVFKEEFLEHFLNMEFTCDVEAVEEGTVVFANEPIFQITGPIDQCQLLESALLNVINFSTLIATKASRCCIAAEGDPILEFGLRRAQGPDGAIMATRASYIGGCAATSNVIAGQKYGIPVAGTHGHSWIMSFDTEEEAFEVYAETSPNNASFLVDTYDTIEGIKKAIKVGIALAAKGQRFQGIRLDSGDIAELSKKARTMLDEAGFREAIIIASSNLDEHQILALKKRGAKVDVWGVGTRMVTGGDQPALSGVYKLTAVRNSPDEPWKPRLKITDEVGKLSTPGILRVRRYFNSDDTLAGDMIYDSLTPLAEGVGTEESGFWDEGSVTMINPVDITRRRVFSVGMRFKELLIPMFRGGKRVYESPALGDIRAYALENLAKLTPAQKLFEDPEEYPVGLEQNLAKLRLDLICKVRKGN